VFVDSESGECRLTGEIGDVSAADSSNVGDRSATADIGSFARGDAPRTFTGSAGNPASSTSTRFDTGHSVSCASSRTRQSVRSAPRAAKHKLFYDNFRSRIRPFLNDSVLAARPESDRENINLALINLDDFAKKINSAPDRNTAIDAAKEFDKEYPLFEPNARIPNGQGQIFRQLSPLNRVPLRTEQSRANDVFDNVSIENQEWKNRYENVFFLIEQRLETLESARGRGRFPSLKKLPLQFSKPCGCVIERSFYSGND